MAALTRAQILGRNLERIRKEKNITRKQLAAYLGVGVDMIGLYENGKRLPPIDKIFQLAEFLKVSIINLTGDTKYNVEFPNIAEIVESNVDDKIFEYRYQRARQMAIGARFTVTESDNGEISLMPPIDISTETGIAGAQKISVEYNIGFAPILIKNHVDFIQIMEDTELFALFNNRPFKQIFIERFYKN